MPVASKLPRKFAEGTTVAAGKTRIEIEDLLKKAGGTSFMHAQKPGLAMLQFNLRMRIIRFTLKVPDEATQAAEHRRVWRVLLLTLRAKLESVRDETVETFEEAFLAQTVPPDGGATVAERMLPQLRDAYAGRAPQMFLTLPSGPTR